jgi:hypothetical protein
MKRPMRLSTEAVVMILSAAIILIGIWIAF